LELFSKTADENCCRRSADQSIYSLQRLLSAGVIETLCKSGLVTRIAIDLDGVIWRGTELIVGSDTAVHALLDAGHEVVFCTNHAQSPEMKLAALSEFGINGIAVVTAAQAAAACCTADQTVLVLGDQSLSQVFVEAGIATVNVDDLPSDGPAPRVDTVVVGAYSVWDRSRIALAADAIRAGASFLATNDDATFPASSAIGPRVLPGNGSLIAAIAAATGVEARVAGKPHSAMAQVLLQHFGGIDIVVGDNAETDGELAARLGAEFALVLSGITTESDLPVTPSPAHIGSDLAGIVEGILATEANLPR
jgi:HAD superfamily hydrolase (TIGR01450 family)